MTTQNKLTTWIGLLVVAIGGCATVRSDTDYDKTADFSRFRTFKVLQGTILPSETGAPPNTMVQERIRSELVSQLANKGLTPTEENPDLWVGYVSGARTQQELVSTGPYDPLMGPYMGAGYWGGGVNTWTYQHGTLVIDVVDADSKKMVWRSTVEADRNKLAELGEPKLIHDAVAKALKAFPPKP